MDFSDFSFKNMQTEGVYFLSFKSFRSVKEANYIS